MSNRSLMVKRGQHGGSGLAMDVLKSVDSDAMLDVVLLSNGGGEIPASRFVLGARSPVLQTMLFPNTSAKLRLDYSSNVIQTLVHFCRTNELGKVAWSAKDEASTRDLVNLCHCAVSFKIEGLQDLAEQLVSSILIDNPHLACAIFDECAMQGNAVDSVKQAALGLIREDPVRALLHNHDFAATTSPGGVSSLSSDTLREILGDRYLCTEEINLFRAVTLFCASDTGKMNKGPWAGQLSHQRRRIAAKKIVEDCLDLSKIAPSDLMGIVSESGLVSEDDIANAMIQVALRVEKDGFQVSKWRSTHTGKKSSRPLPSQEVFWKPPPKTVSGLAIEPETSNSLIDIVVDEDVPVSHSSETLGRSNTRKPKKRKPTAVTPEKKSKKALKFVSQEEENDFSSSCCGSRSQYSQDDSSELGQYLQNTVDTMCFHPSFDPSTS